MQPHYTLRAPLSDGAHGKLQVYPELLRILLAGRGINDADAAEPFLNPDYDAHTHDPFCMKDMNRAAERILAALGEDERIVIYSDYDCDGIPGGALLHDFFTRIGYANFENYIPHRHREGYGVNTASMEVLAKRGAALIITVDSGITDHEAIMRARELGMDVIVTDHHLPVREDGHDALPPAYAVLNPKREDETYPFRELCGTGVAFKLACAVLARGRERGAFTDVPDGWEKWLLDLAGIATVADMVPLTGENRVIAHYGLIVLRKSRRPGVRALCAAARLRQADITEDDIGFMIAPRINAASRMDDPEAALALLVSADDADAQRLAGHLNTINDQRKGVVASMVREMKKTLRERAALREVIVIGNPAWRPALLGLAANTLVEEFNRPVFIWGRDESSTALKGSCRSDGSVSVVELMRASDTHFLEFGGHAYSGGFSIAQAQVHTVEDALCHAYTHAAAEPTDRSVVVDAELLLENINWSTWRVLAHLAPFGEGNPKPVFAIPDVRVVSSGQFGKEKNHFKLIVEDKQGKSIEAIAFFTHADRFDVELARDARIDVLAMVERSTFRGRPELRLRIVDIHPARVPAMIEV